MIPLPYCLKYSWESGGKVQSRVPPAEMDLLPLCPFGAVMLLLLIIISSCERSYHSMSSARQMLWEGNSPTFSGLICSIGTIVLEDDLVTKNPLSLFPSPNYDCSCPRFEEMTKRLFFPHNTTEWYFKHDTLWHNGSIVHWHGYSSDGFPEPRLLMKSRLSISDPWEWR